MNFSKISVQCNRRVNSNIANRKVLLVLDIYKLQRYHL